MAEFVQQSIEEMLPELEQMERIGLFTTEEAKTILRKRKGYEYKLRRRTKCKEDYLHYIKYEMNVLDLVKKRRERTGFNFKKLEIDVAIKQRIHSLFKQATIRFQDDVKLWLSHIQFCRERKEKSLSSKLFTRMLQVHSKKPDLWTLAAKWEFEENLNAENARSLLQRGLRFNSTSKSLWLEYYRMELLYAQKLRKRREILASTHTMDEEEVPDKVLEGAVALIVYTKATESFTDDVDFLLSFLPICRLFDFTQSHEDRIFQDLDELHKYKPQTWEAKALRHLQCHKKGSIEKCFKVFEEAVEEVPGEPIWRMYIDTCLGLAEKKKSKPRKHEKLVQKTLTLFQTASDRKVLAPSLYEKWAEVLTENGQIDEAQGALKGALVQHPQSLLLWKQYLSLLIQNQSEDKAILKAFTEAGKVVVEKESLPLWELVLNYFIVSRSTSTLSELFKKGIVCCREVCEPVKELYLKWTFLTEGIAATRNLCTRLFQMKPLSLAFFKEYISMENAQAKPKAEVIRTAYEAATQEYGETSSDIWIDYIKYEMSTEDTNPELVGNLHFRAVKTLLREENQRFVTQYTLLQTGHL